MMIAPAASPAPLAPLALVLLLGSTAVVAKKGHTVRPSTPLLPPRLPAAMRRRLTRTAALQFEDQEKITLWYNKVGPYNNPQETYQYFDLPFCRPEGTCGAAACSVAAQR
jgi:hypothetical protein